MSAGTPVHTSLEGTYQSERIDVQIPNIVVRSVQRRNL
jgi:hypothetical protein